MCVSIRIPRADVDQSKFVYACSSSSFTRLACGCMVEFRRTVLFCIIIGCVMDEQVSVPCNHGDSLEDRAGVPGIHDFSAWPRSAHHVRWPDNTLFVMPLNRYRFPALESSEKRAWCNTKGDRPFPVETTGSLILFKNVAKCGDAMADGKCRDGVAIKSHPGMIGKFNGFNREVQVEPADMPDCLDKFMHPLRTIDGERGGAAIKRERMD